MTQNITREQIDAKLKNNEPMILVEALPKKYFDAEHLPGAIHIPHDEISQKALHTLPDKAATIVAYCANAQCANSAIAARTLEQLGYTNVYTYEGGKRDWIEAGLPTETTDAASAA